MDEIVICVYCGKNEFYGKFTWLNGKCLCRDCYKHYFEDVYGELYRWDDKDYAVEEMKKLGR